jgi:hypothetical protein
MYGVASFVAGCLALFPCLIILAPFWFGHRIFPSFRSDAPPRHIYSEVTIPNKRRELNGLLYKAQLPCIEETNHSSHLIIYEINNQELDERDHFT